MSAVFKLQKKYPELGQQELVSLRGLALAVMPASSWVAGTRRELQLRAGADSGRVLIRDASLPRVQMQLIQSFK